MAFRKKIYRALDELHADLDKWLAEYIARRLNFDYKVCYELYN